MAKNNTLKRAKNKLILLAGVGIIGLLMIALYSYFLLIHPKSEDNAQAEQSIVFNRQNVQPSDIKDGWVIYANEDPKYRMSFPVFEESDIQPSATKPGWVTYHNEELKYKISFPEAATYSTQENSDYFATDHLMFPKYFYENRMDWFYVYLRDILATEVGNDLISAGIGVEVYDANSRSLEAIASDVESKSTKEVDPETELMYQAAFKDLYFPDSLAEGITSDRYYVGGIDRTKHIFVTNKDNIYVLMFRTAYYPERYEQDLDIMENIINPYFKEVLSTFEYYS